MIWVQIGVSQIGFYLLLLLFLVSTKGNLFIFKFQKEQYFNIVVPSLYSYLIILLICRNSGFIFWLIMELNTVLFLVYLILFNFNRSIRLSKDLVNQIFYYFIIQSRVSILMLFSININNYCFFADPLLQNLCFLFKLGLFPFYFWVMKIIKYLDWFGVFLLFGPQKLYFLIFVFRNFNNFWALVLWFNLFYGAFYIFRRHKIQDLLLGSSIRGVILLFLLFNSSVLIFFSFLITYFYCIFILMKNSNFDSFFTGYIFFLISLVLLSSPFFPFFLLKFQIFQFVYIIYRQMEFFFLWGGLFLCFLGYLFFFFFNFYWREKIYNFNSFVSYRPIFAILFFFFLF